VDAASAALVSENRLNNPTIEIARLSARLIYTFARDRINDIEPDYVNFSQGTDQLQPPVAPISHSYQRLRQFRGAGVSKGMNLYNPVPPKPEL